MKKNFLRLKKLKVYYNRNIKRLIIEKKNKFKFFLIIKLLKKLIEKVNNLIYYHNVKNNNN